MTSATSEPAKKPRSGMRPWNAPKKTGMSMALPRDRPRWANTFDTVTANASIDSAKPKRTTSTNDTEVLSPLSPPSTRLFGRNPRNKKSETHGEAIPP